ncbi:RecT family protein, partial [Orenia metallireducens]
MNNIIEVDNSLIQALEEKKDVLKRTVAKAATNDEFEMFMHLAKQYGLDPFQKEIFFWKYDKDPTIMTSRDGYL